MADIHLWSAESSLMLAITASTSVELALRLVSDRRSVIVADIDLLSAESSLMLLSNAFISAEVALRSVSNLS